MTIKTQLQNNQNTKLRESILLGVACNTSEELFSWSACAYATRFEAGCAGNQNNVPQAHEHPRVLGPTGPQQNQCPG